MTSRILFFFLLLSPFFLLAQQEEEDYVAPEPIKTNYKNLETVYLNKEAWRSWYLQNDQERLKLYMPYQGQQAWQEWNLKGTELDAIITTSYSGRDAWKEWDWQGKHKIRIRTSFAAADSWKSWDIELDDHSSSTERLTVRTRFNNNKDAWMEWEIVHDNRDKGSMRLQTRYLGNKEAWKSWTILDEMPDVNPELKSAAIFAALFSSIMPYAHPKAACTYQGIPLKGKVQLVDSGEDFSIEYVSYDADLKVKFVDWGAKNCGEWEIVDYGADFKVKVVDKNADLRIERVQFSPGMRD